MWSNTNAEKVVLGALLVVPVVLAVVAWRAILGWADGSPPPPTPEVAGAAATSVAAQHAAAPTPRPTIGAPPTLAARADAASASSAASVPAGATATGAATPPTVAPTPVAAETTPEAAARPNATRETAAEPQVAASTGATRQTSGASETAPANSAQQSGNAARAGLGGDASQTAPAKSAQQTGVVAADDPSSAVANFYALVARHDFNGAAQLWSPRMRATFPPAQNINQRFGATQSVQVRRAEVVSENASAGQATVAVDAMESASGSTRHWVGTWSLVRGPNGWLLDQPQLQGG